MKQIKVELADSPSLRRFWDELFDVAWVLALEKVRDHYQSRGFEFPDTWQFNRDIDSLLNETFWE